MQETLYLCDGNVETCSKTGCYKRGFECRHTTDVAHAINPEGNRHFVPDDQGNLWETDAKKRLEAEGKSEPPGTGYTERLLWNYFCPL